MTEQEPPAAHGDVNWLLSGDVRRAVFVLALPVLCEQLLSFCVGFYDTWLSGRISTEATSAIGLAAYVSWLASMLFGLVGVGTTALVARHWGAGEHAQANAIANCSLMLAAVAGAAVCGLIYTTAPWLPWLLAMDAATHDVVVTYLRIDCFGHLFTGFSLIGAAAFRGAGDMRTPMLILGLVSVSNMVFSSVFVFGWGPFSSHGVQGIVWGTILARFLGGILMVWALVKGTSGLKLRRDAMRFEGPLVRRLLRIGIPAATDGGIMWGSQFLFLMVIASLGGGSQFDSTPFAAHIVGIEIEAITYLPAVAWGYAAATLIGQSLGAGLPDRATRAGHEAAWQCCWLAAALSLVFYFGARGIYELMHADAAVHAAGVPAFRMLSFFQVPLVLAIIYTAALRGAGDTLAPMIVTLITVLGIRVPLAWFCGVYLDGGLIGAWIGMCADVALRAILVAAWFIGGRWKAVRV